MGLVNFLGLVSLTGRLGNTPWDPVYFMQAGMPHGRQVCFGSKDPGVPGYCKDCRVCGQALVGRQTARQGWLQVTRERSTPHQQGWPTSAGFSHTYRIDCPLGSNVDQQRLTADHQGQLHTSRIATHQGSLEISWIDCQW